MLSDEPSWDPGDDDPVDFDDLYQDIELPPEVDDLEPGETLAERNARILERNDADRQRDRHKKPSRLPDVSPGELGHDEDAILDFMGDAAAATSFALDDLLAPFQSGPPTSADRERRDALARIIADARDRGARVEALAAVLRRSTSRIDALTKRGLELRSG